MPLTGIAAFFAAIDTERDALVKKAVTELNRAPLVAAQAMMRITPVNSGEAVRNYAAAKGRRPSGGVSVPPAAEPTNNLALGAEAARAPNEAAALADIAAAVSSDKLETIYLTNLIDGSKWALIESGLAPGPPFKSRGPGGQTAVGEQAVRASGGGIWK